MLKNIWGEIWKSGQNLRCTSRTRRNGINPKRILKRGKIQMTPLKRKNIFEVKFENQDKIWDAPLGQGRNPSKHCRREKNHPPSEYRCHFDVGNYRHRILDIDSSVFAHPLSQRPTSESTSNRRRCRCLIDEGNYRSNQHRFKHRLIDGGNATVETT